MLASALGWQEGGGLRVDEMEQRSDRVAIVLSWADPAGRRREWAQLLVLRGGKIVSIQDYGRRQSALRALRRS